MNTHSLGLLSVRVCSCKHAVKIAPSRKGDTLCCPSSTGSLCDLWQMQDFLRTVWCLRLWHTDDGWWNEAFTGRGWKSHTVDNHNCLATIAPQTHAQVSNMMVWLSPSYQVSQPNCCFALSLQNHVQLQVHIQHKVQSWWSLQQITEHIWSFLPVCYCSLPWVIMVGCKSASTHRVQ